MSRRRTAFGRMPQEDERGGGTFRPQLTSLVDVMTILLVFLLKSFSVEGQIVTPAHDLELPVSSSTKPAKPMATLEITQRAVSSEGTVIAPIESFMGQDSLLIEPLHKWMQLLRAQALDTLKSRQVLIQSDKSIPFDIIKRVMYTCSRAGTTDFAVLVLEQQ
jgi:biopolymer transport protein ExbD